MDYHNYSDLELHNAHQFLQSLYENSSLQMDDIETEAKDKLGFSSIGYQLFCDPQREIVSCMDKVIHRAKYTDVSSLPQAEQELAGAIKGLKVLFTHARSQREQDCINRTIASVSQYHGTIQMIFLAKAMGPEFINMFENSNFQRDFTLLNILFGKHPPLDTTSIQSFMHAWNNEEIRPLLHQFLASAFKAKDSNQKVLEHQKELPMIDADNNQTAQESWGELNQMIAASMTNEDRLTMTGILDQIMHGRTMVTNTQIHSEGLELVFNAEGVDPSQQSQAARRTQDLTAGQDSHYEKEIETLNSQLSQAKTNVEKDKIKRMITFWEDSKGYHPRPGTVLYHKASWNPPILSTDPIQPVARTIGFATRDGQKRDTTITLDFTKALGPENLSLTVDERYRLSRLLVECDTVASASKNPMIFNTWKKSQNFPTSIQKVMDEFNDPKFPHLKNLSSEQKTDLAMTALGFNWEVNYYLADDLLNL